VRISSHLMHESHVKKPSGKRCARLLGNGHSLVALLGPFVTFTFLQTISGSRHGDVRTYVLTADADPHSWEESLGWELKSEQASHRMCSLSQSAGNARVYAVSSRRREQVERWGAACTWLIRD
jgi:hypothetical protein